MNRAWLKIKCRERGLDTSGTREELKNRLYEAIQNDYGPPPVLEPVPGKLF